MTAINATTATKKDILIEQSSSSPLSLSSSLERKIAIATEGLTDYVARRLRKIGTRRSQQQQDIETICDYIIAMNAEINPSIMYRKNQIVVLCYLLDFYYIDHYSNNNYDDNNKQNSFIKMTRNDILSYLDSLRKPEASDPLHEWIGTYNLRRVYFLRFFKWLYNPNLKPQDRPTPDVMSNIAQLKRKEQSTIKPTDL